MLESELAVERLVPRPGSRAGLAGVVTFPVIFPLTFPVFPHISLEQDALKHHLLFVGAAWGAMAAAGRCVCC